MASLASRRKQSKPQRLQDKPGDDGMRADGGTDPIDLSTKKSTIFEDKSNMMFPAIDAYNSSHEFLQLYAQLAADRSNSKCFASSSASSPHLSVSPSSEDTSFPCSSRNCNQSFSSRGALCWHVVESHNKEKLIECGNCLERFADPHSYASHDCTRPTRPCSLSCETPEASPDRLSAPPTVKEGMRLVAFDDEDGMECDSVDRRENGNGEEEEEEEPDEDRHPPSGVNLISQLFHVNKTHESSSSAPMDLSSPAELLRNSLSANSFMGHSMPPVSQPPFLMRPPGSFPPRQEVLNNEDDWEALMEISTTDEAEKIRALVGDKPLPTTDPNQCILCRRVLSCKSALQMHYRTHTGERPFKCKICQRAFTTKGNLKTHMGVHRAKHSYRTVMPQMGGAVPTPSGVIQNSQQCPICQKRFFNALQLQTHIAQHTSQLKTASIPQPREQTQLPSGIPPGFLFPFFPSSFSSTDSLQMPPFNLAAMLASQQKKEVEEKPVLALNIEPKKDTVEEEKEEKEEVKEETANSHSPGASSDGSGATHDQTDGSSVNGHSDLEDRKNVTSDEPIQPEIISATPLKSGSENPLDAMKKMWAETEPPPPRQMPVLSKHQCAVCFKHFSSSSALQIHMRTHTGDKPFKCEVCGRAFTTRGNLKVHMGTHMWQQNPSRRGRRIFDTPSSEGTTRSPSTLSSPSIPPFALPPQLGLFPQGAPLDMVMMLWRTVCSVCQKVCASPVELEQHLKDHLSSSNGASEATAVLTKSE